MRMLQLPRAIAVVVTALVMTSVSFNLFAEDTEEESQAVIVGKINKVRYSEQESQPPNLVVTACGEVPTGGYKNPKLVRVVYVTPPDDGMQEYYFFADKPSGQVPQVITAIEASDTWKRYTEEAPWLKGLRIYGVGKGIKEVMLGEDQGDNYECVAEPNREKPSGDQQSE